MAVTFNRREQRQQRKRRDKKLKVTENGTADEAHPNDENQPGTECSQTLSSLFSVSSCSLQLFARSLELL
jgi:hypothetical protein